MAVTKTAEENWVKEKEGVVFRTKQQAAGAGTGGRIPSAGRSQASAIALQSLVDRS
jgi:hypothetical protein